MAVNHSMRLYARWVSPVSIKKAEQFDKIREDLYGWYVLDADIDLSGIADWNPIGNYESDYEMADGEWWKKAFKGRLDGQGRIYLDDLNRHECKEVLGTDFDKMTSMAYLMKEGKLKRDMEALNDMTLKERGIECVIKGFKPVTTKDLYHAIEKGTVEMAEMLKKVHQKIEEAPITLYGNFFRYQKSLCKIQPVQIEHMRWKRDVGCLTYDLLKDRQTYIVAQFLIKTLK